MTKASLSDNELKIYLLRVSLKINIYFHTFQSKQTWTFFPDTQNLKLAKSTYKQCE